MRKMELYVFMFMLAALVPSENKGKSVDSLKKDTPFLSSLTVRITDM